MLDSNNNNNNNNKTEKICQTLIIMKNFQYVASNYIETYFNT